MALHSPKEDIRHELLLFYTRGGMILTKLLLAQGILTTLKKRHIALSRYILLESTVYGITHTSNLNVILGICNNNAPWWVSIKISNCFKVNLLIQGNISF